MSSARSEAERPLMQRSTKQQKIGLVGLYSIDNMGDRLLCETTRFLVESCAKDANIVEIDAAPRKMPSYPGLRKLNLIVSAFLIRYMLPILSRTAPKSKARYYFERLAWRTKTLWHFKKVIPGCDVVIFSGGGFLKFKNQGLNYLVEQIVGICEQHDVPVMLSAVGIEGYDIGDFRCQRLKAALKSPAIRTVTTRDYLETLQESYEVHEPIHTSLVGDPAFWVPETYGIRKQTDATRIGINLIRADIFQHYENQLSAQELKAFYIKLIELLDEEGVDWVLFSNGMDIDHEFGLTLLRDAGHSQDKILPPPQTARDLISMISGFKAILGARMHACISAYALDVPVVGLIWNEKLSRFTELTHQRHMFFDESELNAREAAKKLLNTTDASYDEGVRQDLKNRTRVEIMNFLERT